MRNVFIINPRGTVFGFFELLEHWQNNKSQGVVHVPCVPAINVNINQSLFIAIVWEWTKFNFHLSTILSFAHSILRTVQSVLHKELVLLIQTHLTNQTMRPSLRRASHLDHTHLFHRNTLQGLNQKCRYDHPRSVL